MKSLDLNTLTVNEYQLDLYVHPPTGETIVDVVLRRVRNALTPDSPDRWAITEWRGGQLGKDGRWYRLGLPSNCQPGNYEMVRWASAEEALEFWNTAEIEMLESERGRQWLAGCRECGQKGRKRVKSLADPHCALCYQPAPAAPVEFPTCDECAAKLRFDRARGHYCGFCDGSLDKKARRSAR